MEEKKKKCSEDILLAVCEHHQLSCSSCSSLLNKDKVSLSLSLSLSLTEEYERKETKWIFDCM
jgi:hypothetical protein